MEKSFDRNELLKYPSSERTAIDLQFKWAEFIQKEDAPQITLDEIKLAAGVDLAYIEYEKGWEIFTQAQESENQDLYRQAVSIFGNIVTNYPNTEAEIGALSNMGICYEALSRWQDAIGSYENVIRRYEEGAAVSDEALNFAIMHRDYIVANRL